MRTGLSDSLDHIDDLRKTAIIDRELNRLNVDIAALQETRLADCGSLKEKHYTFFWQGKSAEETREYGAGFAVENTLLPMMNPPTGGSERILAIRLSASSGPAKLLSAYAPTAHHQSQKISSMRSSMRLSTPS